MKYEDKTTKEDMKNKIIRIDVTAENWEENKMLAKSIAIDVEPISVEVNICLNKGN